MARPPSLTDEERAALISYLDGELPPKAAQVIEARLHTDPRLRAEADALERTWALLDHLPRPEPSPSFTHRTLDRLATLPTSPLPQPRVGWRRIAVWAAVWLMAFALGSACCFAVARLLLRSPPTDEELLSDPHLLENLHEYRLVGDLRLLRALDAPDLFGDDLAPRLPSLANTLAELTAEDVQRNQQMLERWRGEPGHLDRLRQALAEFHALPADEQDRLRQLDRALQAEDSYTRHRLVGVLQRYTAWVTHVSAEEDRQRIAEAVDPTERLRRITEIREKEWIQHLPSAVRQPIEARQGNERSVLIKQVRDVELRRRREWAETLRGGQAGDRPHAGGLRLIDLPPEVQTFVHDTLRPLLWPGEQARLDRSQGQGTVYARLLLEFADKYGWSIPGSTDPKKPMDVGDLNKHYPGLVRPNRMTEKEKEKLARMRTEVQKWPEFGIATLEFMHQRDYHPGQQPRWAPCRPADFDPAIQQLIERRLPSLLTPEEAARLKKTAGDWPEYPKLLSKVIREKGLSVPGMSLPGTRTFWVSLAAGLPEIEDDVLLDFALRELTTEERTTLHFSPADPTSRERLKETYYSRHPDRLVEQLQSDYQKQIRKGE